jgi:indolepyruvate decarboxylase
VQLVEALIRALQQHGAREIFGIPGDFALPMFGVIEQTGILPLYTLSHEPAVGFAADAAARFNRELGVAAVTYGPGALNMVNAVACAYAEQSPVVVISGAPSEAETDRGLLLHHQGKTLDSQLRIYEEITCDQARLDDAERAPGEIARVLRSCRERSLPVYIEIPREMATLECAPVESLPPSPVDTSAVAECADEVLAHLRSAKSPVLMVGVEVRRQRVEEKVAELSTRLGLPVVTTFMGRGLLSDSGVPVAGTYIGVAGRPEITELVESSDGLLMLGVLLCDTNFGVASRQIDVRRAVLAGARQVRISYHLYPDIPLSALLEALLERVDSGGRAASSASTEAQYPTGLEADQGPIEPTDIARAVNDMMRVHGSMPIAADMGDCLFTAMDIEHTSLVAPGYYAGMGFGIPAGLGAQVSTGQRPLILVGDGAFQMTGWELGNCRRYGWDPIVLVFNNRSWEMLRAFQPAARFNDLDDWHFADIAPSLGGIGERVETRLQLREALERATTQRGRFALIEIMLERGTISPTLRRFVDGFQKGR